VAGAPRQSPRGEAVHGGGGAHPALRDGLPLGGDVGENLSERVRRRRRQWWGAVQHGMRCDAKE